MKIICTGGSGFIGTHLLDSILDKEIELLNIDIKPPQKKEHFHYWRLCNILDGEYLDSIFSEFQPSHIVHLAARASTVGKTMSDFLDNTVGTKNVLNAIKKTPSIERVVITSTQHVRKPGSGYPKNDIDFAPHGLYGASKVITENLTRQAKLDCTWTIIRPTTIWGPLHPYLPHGLWKYMKNGLYFHPRNDPVVRSYGFVKNVIWQIEKILQAPSSTVDRKVFYVGEKPIKQVEWINSFSKALTNKSVSIVPKQFVHMLAWVGDSLGKVGIKFPMDSPRYFNLTTTNPVPLEPIFNAFGAPPISLADGIQETIFWLDERGY